jgi:hypothetical protein
MQRSRQDPSPRLLAALAQSFVQLQLRVTGECMRPAVAPGDALLLADCTRRPPRFGDIVLISLPQGLRLHRVVWPPPLLAGRMRTQADRACYPDPPVGAADVLGCVVGHAAAARPVRSRLRAVVSLGRAALRRALDLAASPAS